MSAADLPPEPDQQAPRASPPGAKARAWLWLLAKLLVAGLAFTYVFTRQSWSELAAALERLTPSALALAVLLQFACLSVASVRWQSLLRAYGAERVPRLFSLMRVYYVGHFYNTYLPGAVGGDFVRGVATRSAFASGGATMSVAVVFVERAVGMLGMLIMVALVVPFQAQGHTGRDLLPYVGIGLAAFFIAIIGLTQAPRLAHYVPRAIGNIMRNLPVLSRVAPFALACLVSIAIQGLLICCGHVLLAAIYPEARFSDSMLALPLAGAAAFFPLSIAGAGPRDAVLVSIYTLAGVPRPAAAATALALLFTTLLVGASGGILQLLAPLTVDRRDDT